MKIKYGMLFFMLFIFITGCGHSENSVKVNSEEQNLSWQANFHQLETSYKLTVISDYIYGCYTRDDQVLIDRIDKKTQTVNATFALENVSLISGMQADQNGNIYVLGKREESMGMWRIGADGTFQDFISMELEDAGDGSELFLKGIYAGTDGLLYVWCEMEVP